MKKLTSQTLLAGGVLLAATGGAQADIINSYSYGYAYAYAYGYNGSQTNQYSNDSAVYNNINGSAEASASSDAHPSDAYGNPVAVGPVSANSAAQIAVNEANLSIGQVAGSLQTSGTLTGDSANYANTNENASYYWQFNVTSDYHFDLNALSTAAGYGYSSLTMSLYNYDYYSSSYRSDYYSFTLSNGQYFVTEQKYVNGGWQYTYEEIFTDQYLFSGDLFSGDTVYLQANTQSSGSSYANQSAANLSFDLSLTPTSVPVPAAAWLFGSGIIGLIGLARRKG